MTFCGIYTPICAVYLLPIWNRADREDYEVEEPENKGESDRDKDDGW
jgi:hypothetical protein